MREAVRGDVRHAAVTSERICRALFGACLMVGGGFGAARGQAAAPPVTGLASAGNLADDFYVKPGCARPQKMPPGKPVYNDPQDVALYNLAVLRFNRQAKAFNACIKDYVDKASRDIEWIQFTVNDSVAKAMGRNPPAAPAAPGNMAAGFYPSTDCIAPGEPLGAPPDGGDVQAMRAYNSKVRNHNVLAETFNQCIGTYMARAQADMGRIRDAVHDAVAQSQAP